MAELMHQEYNETEHLVDLDLVPELKDINGNHSMREFMFAALSEFFDKKDGSAPGVAGTIVINGNIFQYEFVVTKVIIPNGGTDPAKPQ